MNEKARTIVFNISALMFSGRKEWVICLTISALLQLYTAFVTPKKEN